MKNSENMSVTSGGFDWGDLRRLRPVSDCWGFDRGQPVDRYYIEAFLAENASDIRGDCLELLIDYYVHQYGGESVEKSDVLDIDPNNQYATIVADLARVGSLPEGTYDCIVMTQTLHHIYDAGAALHNAYIALKVNGVLLITVSALNKIDPEPEDFWRFTADALKNLISQHTTASDYSVRTYGNVLACVAFLMGIASQELEREELNYHDPLYPLTVAARVVRCE